MQIHIILVNPSLPENIGFIARAMKTHGYISLRIVSKDMDILNTNARKTAYGSHDILEDIVYFDHLEEALLDIDVSIGTTSKERTLRKEAISSSEVSEFILAKKGIIEQVALVFGNEENGLSKEEINLCDVVSTIPLQVSYPSLNLSQSVLVFLYELNRNTVIISSPSTDSELNTGLYRELISETDLLLDWLEMDANPSYLRRVKDRIRKLKAIDAHIVMALLKKLKSKGISLK